MTMEPLLNAMRIPYRVVDQEANIGQAIQDAFSWSYAAYYHSAIVLSGSVVR
jgi:sulfopyruvate decarboxylase subunit alpha